MSVPTTALRNVAITGHGGTGHESQFPPGLIAAGSDVAHEIDGRKTASHDCAPRAAERAENDEEDADGASHDPCSWMLERWCRPRPPACAPAGGTMMVQGDQKR